MTTRRPALPIYDFKSPPPDGILPFEITPIEQIGSLAQLARPHRHSFFQILYVTGGAGKHIIDFDEYDLHPPTVYFLAPGRVHYYHLSEPVSGYAILFTDEFLMVSQEDQQLIARLTFPAGGVNPPLLRIGEQEKRELADLIATIYAEYSGRNSYRYSTLQAYLHILLVKFQRMYAAKSEPIVTDGTHQHAQQFRQLVAQHFITEHQVQFYADEMGLNASYLATIIKEVTGKSPGKIVRSALALEAKRLLAHGGHSAETISQLLNFSDPSYFGRFFKREVGVSPATFRNQIKEKYQNA